MAIKIIKPGKKPETTKRFTCKHCGCVFKADKGDYEEMYSLNNGYYLLIDCPTCGRSICRKRDE